MAAQYRQIGNAVPVALGAAIGAAVVACEGAEGKTQANPCVNSQLAAAQSRLKASARNKVSRKDANLSLFAEA